MSRLRSLSPEARELLAQERVIEPLAPLVRARALARARAALVAGGASMRVPVCAPRTRWALAAALVLVASAAVGAVAYEVRARMAPASGRPARAEPVGPFRPVPAVPSVTTPATVHDPVLQATGETQSLSRADAAREELRLLRQGRAAVAREDFASALRPIAEHARRFRDGRLAEEREALRVKALVGLGRIEDARRAVAAFEARFPRSVLLPAVNHMLASGR